MTKVSDFGLAKMAFDRINGWNSICVLGTPGYINAMPIVI